MQSMPPQYPGAPYYQMGTENLLKKRYVLAVNAVALLALWFAAIIAIVSNDLNARGFARLLAISAGVPRALGLQLLGSSRDRAAGRDDVIHDPYGLAPDREGFRLHLHRIRIDALFHEEVERDAGNRGRLLREPKRALVRREKCVDLRGL